MIQVRTKAPVFDRGLHIDVRGGDDAHVDIDRTVAAQAVDGAFLQETQQARLTLERQIADFIEKHGAAVSGFDAPYSALIRAREGAALVAEQLGLQQMRRNRTAVDGDERRVTTRRVRVNRRRRQLLARTGFTGDKDGCVVCRHFADRAE